MNKLLKAEHPEYGIWYFTNTNKCARALNIGRTTLDYHIERSGKCNEWNIEWVDGNDVIYKYIDCTHDEIFEN